ELPATLPIFGTQFLEPSHKLVFDRVDGDVLCLDIVLPVELFPVRFELFCGSVFTPGQSELEGRVDPLGRILEPEHGLDADIIFTHDRVDPPAHAIEQEEAGDPEPDEE